MKMSKLAQLVLLLTCGKWPVEIQDTDTTICSFSLCSLVPVCTYCDVGFINRPGPFPVPIRTSPFMFFWINYTCLCHKQHSSSTLKQCDRLELINIFDRLSGSFAKHCSLTVLVAVDEVYCTGQ
jgi:hypothetical protein